MPGNLLRKRLIINAALVAGLAALGLTLWLDTDSRNNEEQPLTALKKEAVGEVVIERPGEPAIVLEKHDGGWRIREPVRIAANDLRVNSILNVLHSRSLRRYPYSELDPAGFGLEPAAATLDAGGLTLRFGDTAPLEGQRYVRVGDTLHLTEDNYLPLIARGLNGLIDTRVIPGNAALNRLALPGFSLHRTDTGSWSREPQIPGQGADALQTTVDEWRRLTALSAQYSPGAEFEDKGEIVLELENGETLRYRIVDSEQTTGLFRPDREVFYALSQDKLEALLGEPTTSETTAKEHGTTEHTDITE